MSVQITQLGTRELWDAFQANPMEVYVTAATRMKDAGMKETPTISRVLEEISPTEKGDRLDAYERLLQQAGIRTKSDPVAGHFASKADIFTKNKATRALFLVEIS